MWTRNKILVGVSCLLVSYLLFHFSISLLSHCHDDVSKALHWPLTYTQHAHLPPTKDETKGRLYRLPSTALYSTVALMNILLVPAFAALWAVRYFDSSESGYTRWSDAISILHRISIRGYTPFTCNPTILLKRIQCWLLTSICLLIIAGITLSVGSLTVLVDEQVLTGNAAFRGHFSAALEYYQSTSKSPISSTSGSMLRQLQRLQGTLKCCGLEKGSEDFRFKKEIVEVVDGSTNFTTITRTTLLNVPVSCCGRLVFPLTNGSTSPSKAEKKAENERQNRWIQWLIENPLANCSSADVPPSHNVGCQSKLAAAYFRPISTYLALSLPLQFIMAGLTLLCLIMLD